MEKNIFIQSLDEFNYTSSVNFFTKTENPTSVLCLPGFENMFYNFDNIKVSSIKNTEGLLLSSDVVLKSDIYELLKNEALFYSNKLFTQSDINTENKHIYEFMFNSLSKDMLTYSSELYKPFKKDYEDVKKRLSGITKKIVTINGRNLSGDRSNRNNFLFTLIEFLLSNNFFVINCTIPNVNLYSKFNSDSYLEINEFELYNYSKNISFFLNSDCLISVGNSAGITNHICTKTNLILYGEGGWVDNVNFGYKNQSLYEISKNIKPTFISTDFNHINEILSSINRPNNVSFFNENKII
jgi:hypothetical protein